MKFSWLPTFLLLSSGVTSLSIPNLNDLVARHADPNPETSDLIDLEKRRGGGGGGGRSGGGFSSGGSGGGRTSSSGSSRGGISNSGSTSSSSNLGGSTSHGSGVQPKYGGGSYYAGGATTPYRSGSKTAGGISPHLVAGAGLGFLGGAWLAHSYYLYPYPHAYLYNEQSYPVECVCAQYSECGCGDNQNQTYYTSLFHGERPENSTNVRVLDVNGTTTIYINGTLPNGTTAASGASPAATVPAHLGGYLVTVAVVAAAVWGI
ncbi:hypothetical protein N7474_010528 [Penicillium riverlandense]|uniref:uncharacterized protein n=1 Tax=Penicillium riverlandense TaxID=1903569 RepID=UPI0025468340|nr:uncharacterized protein N7474_010528 [Penicillium riverlandense]KAJ5806936.1 hypothetical protein N7474_010528 [Penicillium riverlandense]